MIALTFDAGGSNAGSERILETLSATGTPATFFFTGAWAREFPETARRIAARYPIGNHTQTHPDLTKLSDEQVRSELRQAAANILQVTDVDPHPYFRFPFGEVDTRVIRIVNGLCYVPFRWTTDSLAWQGTSGGQTADKVANRIITGARPGGIVLMHIGDNPKDRTSLDADALPRVIRELSAQGYTFVTLEEVLPATP